MCPIVNISRIDIPSLLWTGTFMYLIAFLYVLIPILSNKPYHRSIFYTLLIGGFIFQTLGLYLRGMQIGAFPLASPLETSQVISWTAVLLIILIQIAFSLKLLGFFGSALISLINLFSLLMYELPNVANFSSTLLSNPWIEFHIILAIVGYSSIGLSAITCAMYLLQDYGLSHKLGGTFYARLPSLAKLTTMATRLLLIGAVLYGLAILIGTFIYLTGSGDAPLRKMLVKWTLGIYFFGIYFPLIKKYFSFKTFSCLCITGFTIALLDFWDL